MLLLREPCPTPVWHAQTCACSPVDARSHPRNQDGGGGIGHPPGLP
jgi:hypothetical protein